MSNSPPPPNKSSPRTGKRLEVRAYEILVTTYRSATQYYKSIYCQVKSDYSSSKDYNDAVDFFKNFEKKDKVEYGWIMKYAKDLQERFEKTDGKLDEKADSIIKYLGGGSALLTFGALVSIKPEKPETCLLGLIALVSLIPSLCFALLAVQAALRVRSPQSAATPPPLTKAVHLAENYASAEEAELNLVLICHPICEAYAYRNKQKSDDLRRAHEFYAQSLLFVLIPVITISAALVYLALKPPSATSDGPATPKTTLSSDRQHCLGALHAQV